ncbi:MAG: GTPase ObgE [Firmicutes bacterium]|nr:GTPase ObgE [Bacillota bacterium]
MFVDHVKINIESGAGGHGHIGFHRTKYVPNGGPNGGDGGNGGNVIFVADSSINTLVNFRYKRRFLAENGKNGSTNNCSGAKGKDCIINVPVGTIIRFAETNQIIADLAVVGDTRTLLKGGRGGRGNQHFATPTRQAPKFSEDGKPSKSMEVTLELKLIADAGIIGFPNAGKSTLLSMVTNAKPKIAGYQFTTLAPNLGVVRNNKGNEFVLADIPGLIEGASTGIGLGHDFLRHIERTKVLIHVVDVSAQKMDETELTPLQLVQAINNELELYNPQLLERPQILVANKIDLLSEEEIADCLQSLKTLQTPIFAISAATNRGLTELMQAVFDTLAEYPSNIIFEPDQIFDLATALQQLEQLNEKEQTITVEKDGDIYIVEGYGIERILGYTNMNDEKGFAFFQKFLREKGIIAKLEELGIVEGDTVQIYELQFDYYP